MNIQSHLACFVAYDRATMGGNFKRFLVWMNYHVKSYDVTKALFIFQCPKTQIFTIFDPCDAKEDFYSHVLNSNDDTSLNDDKSYLKYYTTSLKGKVLEDDKFNKITFLGDSYAVENIAYDAKDKLVSELANIIDSRLVINGLVRMQICYAQNIEIKNGKHCSLVEEIKSKINKKLSISAPTDLSLVPFFDRLLGRSIDLPPNTDVNDFLKIARYLIHNKNKLNKTEQSLYDGLFEYITNNAKDVNVNKTMIVFSDNTNESLQTLIAENSIKEDSSLNEEANNMSIQRH